MHQWRISKYNPQFRDARGPYCVADWTSTSDIGKIFDNRLFRLEDYLAVEDRYVSVAMRFIEESNVSSLVVLDLEVGPMVSKHGLDDLLFRGTDLKEGQRLSGGDLVRACRLNLRELIWCRLEEPGKFYIHFGYDYYMYLGSIFRCIESLRDVRDVGLFAEPMSSPYMSDQS